MGMDWTPIQEEYRYSQVALYQGNQDKKISGSKEEFTYLSSSAFLKRIAKLIKEKNLYRAGRHLFDNLYVTGAYL